MQNALLKRIFNMTAKREIMWYVAETQTINCNRYEGKSETHEFIIMEMAQNNYSYVGYKNKGDEDYIIIEADENEVERFIKIIKSTKIKLREMV